MLMFSSHEAPWLLERMVSSGPAPGVKPSLGWWIGRLECAGSVERSLLWVSTAQRCCFPPPAARCRCGDAPRRLRITTGLNAVQAIGQLHHEVSTNDQVQTHSWSLTLALPLSRRSSPSSLRPSSNQDGWRGRRNRAVQYKPNHVAVRRVQRGAEHNRSLSVQLLLPSA